MAALEFVLPRKRRQAKIREATIPGWDSGLLPMYINASRLRCSCRFSADR